MYNNCQLAMEVAENKVDARVTRYQNLLNGPEESCKKFQKSLKHSQDNKIELNN